jgi:hypothetical protein
MDVGGGVSMEAVVFSVSALAGLTGTGDAVSASAASVCASGAKTIAGAV